MDCTGYRELISAQLDGEVTEVERSALRDHLNACQGCRSFEADAVVVNRAVRVVPSPVVPDQTAVIMRAMALPARSLSGDLLRAAVAALGLARIASAVALFVSVVAAGSSHTSMELAAADLAIGAGLVLVAARPELASGLVAVLVVLAGATVFGGAGDVIAGRVAWNSELLHVVDAAAALLVWRLSLRRLRSRGRIAIPA